MIERGGFKVILDVRFVIYKLRLVGYNYMVGVQAAASWVTGLVGDGDGDDDDDGRDTSHAT